MSGASWLAAASLLLYPVDGYERTGIRRLLQVRRLIEEGSPRAPVAGARLGIADVRLRLAGRPVDPLASVDPELQRSLARLFADRDPSYAVALVDLGTPESAPRYAALRPDRSFQPGSLGKLAVAAGLLAELARLRPLAEGRVALLRERQVVAGEWIRSDHHRVPLFDPETGHAESRVIREGDVFSLYEWLDHMLSPSSNAAASTVWKEALLMRGLGPAYPPTPEAERAFLEETPRARLQELALDVVAAPLRALQIAESDWKLGSFFTDYGQRRLGQFGSGATPRGLIRFLVSLEQGRVVDFWTSLELKRLLYVTAQRIRYASAPRLADAAVYFKSGSLYRCRPEQGFECRPYAGNVENTMSSVAVVEKPDGRVYLVVVMSNVLRTNSAVEHQSVATFVDRLLAP